MVDPLSLTVVTALLIKSAPIWLPSIRDAFISKGAEFVIDTTLKGGRSLLGRDEKEQVRHLELALKNAVERGLAQFHTRQERDQYRSILTYLSEPSTQNDLLRREALHLFTLSDSPDFTELTEKYNLRQRISALAKHSQHEEVDAAPYLSSFFQALIAELYVDPFFRQQVSNVLQVRAAMSMQRSLTEVVSTLHQMSEYLVDDYTTGQFEQDVETYAAHIERTLHYLKL